METQLAQNLLTLGLKFSEVKKLELSTVGKNCAADGRFFSRIKTGKTFTARKYDCVVRWFSAHWPDGAAWPDGIARPAVEADDGSQEQQKGGSDDC